MSISVLCPKCGKKLSAPDTAAGKRAKCPHCGQIMQLPEKPKPAPESQPPSGLPGPGAGPSAPSGASDTYGFQGAMGGFSADEFDEMLNDTGPRVDRPEPEPDRRPCPACGEMIVRGAAKCRFCGEIFDPVLRNKQQRKKKRRGGGAGDEDLTGGEILLAILCSGIGCIMGLVFLVQGKPKAGKMIGLSLLSAIAWNVLRFVVEILAQQGGPPM